MRNASGQLLGQSRRLRHRCTCFRSYSKSGGKADVRAPTLCAKSGREQMQQNEAKIRGRDASYLAPPAQIRTCGLPAYGSHLGCVTANACRMRSSACDTRAWFCVQCVLCWCAFPSVPALRSTNSAADHSALFVGFTATMARSDFSCPCNTRYVSRRRQQEVA